MNGKEAKRQEGKRKTGIGGISEKVSEEGEKCIVTRSVRSCKTIKTLKGDRKVNQFDYKLFYRRNLPHVQPPGATFFITFRLAGSLPQALLRQWAEEKRRHSVEQARIADEQKRKRHELEWQRRWFRNFEKSLDKVHNGPTWLKDDRIAAQVTESLHYRDDKVYRLDACCIMPNHVHTVFAPLATQTESYNSLASIMHSLKGYTARKANRLLERRGAFWAHESYESLCA